MDIAAEVKKFLINELLLDAETDNKAITSDKDLISEGIIDSMGILKLTAFIEEKFNIKVTDEDINPENFRTIIKLQEFIESKQN